MKQLAMLLVALWSAAGGNAAESYSARTLTFDYVAPPAGPVLVQWEGEIVNDSAADATLCAVLSLRDARGAVLAELESAALNVKRFGSERRQETFPVAPELWIRTDTLEETARLSVGNPVNGRRICQVEVYTTSWCPYCRKAKEFFVSRGVPFTEYDVEADPAAAREKDRLAPGAGIPVAVIDGRVIQGFSAARYERALSGVDE
ncbi:MAG: glutaredoxin family protein [Deferrisomatales bacterium]|nr:glutaredoxin family protein [Deferrisomatales bacterium]